MVYRLRKSFQFRNSCQANAFLDIANIYGKGRAFGSVVIYEASLEFIVWRKLLNLAKIVSECTVRDIDIYKMTSEAGFKPFREAGL
ncbi:MAG: hypothetical protein C4560_01375 [Nitrospiraceae bacterium]|nr:MAG: hypothetical protein C4560_01375 [Nitrospiraceae bacterium]